MVIIANNIFYHPHLGGISCESETLQAQGFIDGNLFALRPGTAFAGNGLTTRGILFDFASYQRTGHDAHAVVGDPLFVKVEAGDFHLQASSPAIKRGVTSYTTMYDKDGKPRDRQRPTIGAYEYR